MTPNQQSVRIPIRRSIELARDLDQTGALARYLDQTGALAPDLDQTLALARDLDQTLARARDLARHLARHLDRAIANAIITLTGGRPLARGSALAYDLDHALADARILAIDVDRALASVRDFDHVRVLARDLAAVVVDARACARDLAPRARDLAARDRALARALSRDIASAHTSAVCLRRAVDGAWNPGRDGRRFLPGIRPREGADARRVAPSACRLVTVTVWLVPTRRRARYGEEWRSELHDLAAAGAGCREQLGYTVRLLVRAVPLRLAVLSPRREKAS